jgi:GTPase SAR1 family protein
MVEIDGLIIKLQLWDIYSREKYSPIPKLYFNGAHAFILVFDISNRSSF